MSKSSENCVSAGLLLRALDEELPPRQAWLVKLHLERCESCQARLAELGRISSRLAELHQAALPQDASSAFAARLEWEGSPEQQKSSWRRGLVPRTRWRQLAWCGVLALLVVIGMKMQTSRTRPSVQPSARPFPAAIAPPVPKQLLTAGSPARRVRRARRSVKRPAPEAPVRAQSATGVREVATPFFALPFSDAALPLDQAAVIRVELPRSALELTGFPVDADRRNEPIRADLVLGADGLARAIRFIR
jgi:hypothetical protein